MHSKSCSRVDNDDGNDNNDALKVMLLSSADNDVGNDNDDDDDKDEDDDDENDDGDTVDVDMHAECPQYQMSRD